MNFHVTTIENLSNEIIYEIFDYLDGISIYAAFINLNHRFEQLLTNNCSYALKIRFSSKTTFDDQYEKLFSSAKYSITSLCFENHTILNQFLSIPSLYSSYQHLQSLVLVQVSTSEILTVLFYLKRSPQFFSLSIYMDEADDDLNNIYQLPKSNQHGRKRSCLIVFTTFGMSRDTTHAKRSIYNYSRP